MSWFGRCGNGHRPSRYSPPLLSSHTFYFQDYYETVKTILFSDSAVAGEAAGSIVSVGISCFRLVAEGCVVNLRRRHGADIVGHRLSQGAGGNDSVCTRDAAQKIIRGLAIGISLICFGLEEKADEVVKLLLLDKDPILRYVAFVF